MLFIFCSLAVMAQDNSEKDRIGMPGDNFNLAAALDLFRHSPTIEAFEAAVNADTSKLNNLDLNNDGKVDYIKVFDRLDGNVHTIILQTDINEKESQDIAVIFVEKKGEEVVVQMVGDEDLYGKDYIIEPASDQSKTGTANPAYQDSKGQTTVVNNYYYEDDGSYDSHPSYCEPPASWLIIGFIYGPYYSPWVSPWYWGYYPTWWSPWSPWYWDTYYYHWYYYHSWNGWWYWHTPHTHFSYWYGPYRTNRRSSGIYIRNRSEGVYNRGYTNPRPEPRPQRKQSFPSHALDINKNPSVVKPGISKPRQESITPAVKPIEPRKQEVKPEIKPDQEQKPKRRSIFNFNRSKEREENVQPSPKSTPSKREAVPVVTPRETPRPNRKSPSPRTR